MATTSDDKTVRVWDLTVRELPVPLGPPLEGHQEAVNSVAIGANGIMRAVVTTHGAFVGRTHN